MNDKNTPGGTTLLGEGCCAKAQCEPTPQMLLRDRARSLRQEADRLEALALALPGQMSLTATNAFNEILLRRPIF
jgi:hypothetical protein